MPVTVGVFVTPGNASGRGNRSFEYDALTDDYVRFLVEELLPYIARTHKLNLSTDGNDRSIAGTSSGGICGSRRRGNVPTPSAGSSATWAASAAIGRLPLSDPGPQFEPKPIRVFLQDGSNDLKFAYGDWWLANQEMERR